MKTILITSVLFFAIGANSQNKSLINRVTSELIHSLKIVKYRLSKNKPSFIYKTANSNGSTWFNQLDFLELIQQTVATFNAMHTFSDSAFVLGYGASGLPVNTRIHKEANYMGPSFMAQQTIITDKFATYTLDSVSVGYLYERNTGLADNTADSLIIQVIAEKTTNNYDLGAFS